MSLSIQNKENILKILIVIMAAFLVFIYIWGAFNLNKEIGGAGNKDTASVASQSTGSAKKEKEESQKTDDKKLKTSDGKVNLEILTESLLNDVKYETKLEAISSDVANGMVELQKNSRMKMYMGEGTFADEVVIIAAANEADAEKDQTAVETHLIEMKNSFADYLPEQAKKIEGAVVVRSGNYVIACVSSDSKKAKDIIVAAFK